MEIFPPYLLFLGDAPDELAAKTARGVVDWRPEACIGQLRLPGCRADVGLPDLTPAEAAGRGARSLVVGVANAGGVLPEAWIEALVAALDQGLDVASGLHTRLSSFAALRQAALRNERRLVDVRHTEQRFQVGRGDPRPGRRVLTVGTDCSVGKKYTALSIWRELVQRGVDADFRATGQTGILIAGRGVAIDAVPADFISGAAEELSPANHPQHWDVVEGQGSLFHPSFAGVSLGLLHGTQPDVFVVCHEPTRMRMRGIDRPLPGVVDVIEATLVAGRVTNPEIRCAGVSVDTSLLASQSSRIALLENVERELSLPVVDPLVTGIGTIVNRLLGG